ncbi:MAG: hypothetical protein QOE68_4531, partial [Thermoanaerobaculia bacterium]|nr:hypothetical protein [Thermoanaerobaculia bacterium]
PAKALLLGLQMIWLITKHRIREALAGRGYQIPVADDRLGIEQTPTMNS